MKIKVTERPKKPTDCLFCRKTWKYDENGCRESWECEIGGICRNTAECTKLEPESRLPKEGVWITADNPPKNEGLYLVGLSVGCDNEYVVRLARYTKDLSEALFSSKLSGDGWYRWDGDNDCDVICHPKYWMELPEPPKGEHDERI